MNLEETLGGSPAGAVGYGYVEIVTPAPVEAQIREGSNGPLVELCNRDSDWRFNLRVTDASGRSLVTSGHRGRIEVRNP